MSFKYFVYGGGTGNTKENPATNRVAFATKDEAERAGHELLSRWFGPDNFLVRESDEPVNYAFPVGANRPISLETEHA